MQHEPNELLRKSLHIIFGLGAVTLRWLPWWLAAAVAAAAVAGNWLLLHRIVGRSVARHERGWDAGIVIYPAMVCLLIVVFRDALWIAAVAWVILAFGDGVATIAGRTIRGPRLPWNRDKSWSGFLAFLAAAGSGALAIGIWMGEPRAGVILLAVLAAAIAESLRLGVDDNVVVPIAAAVTLIALPYSPEIAQPMRVILPWIGVNTVLAVVGYLARSVDGSGAAGGWVLGTIIIFCAGWPMYVALLAFFVLGTATTKLGYRRKAASGLAQEKGGRRSFSHAFSNVGVATICAVAFLSYATGESRFAGVIYLMGIASLATAAADTTASEVGQLFGRRAFLPLTFKPVPRGTEGAVSIEGTLAGVAAALLVAYAGAKALVLSTVPDGNARPAIVLVTVAAFLGSYVESIVGSWNRKRSEPVPNGVLNFFNTAIGAIALLYLSRWHWAIEVLSR